MKLYVGNLPYSLNDEKLNDLFSQFNPSTSRVITDRDSGRSRGYGFVEIENKEEAENAISELNGKDVDGRKIIVNEARPKTNDNGFNQNKRRNQFRRHRDN